jgi:SNF2 family DNA or RNA helicase
LNFADRNRFASQFDFVAKFGDLKDASQVANLHNMLKPYLLRRVKEDVEKSLPPKEETIVEVRLQDEIKPPSRGFDKGKLTPSIKCLHATIYSLFCRRPSSLS